MILGIEIAMIVMGIIAIFKGKLTISKTKVVTGWPARLLGLVCLAPLPIVFLGAAIWAIVLNVNNDTAEVQVPATSSLVGLEIGTVIFCGAIAFGVGSLIARPQEASPKSAKAANRKQTSQVSDADDGDESGSE